MTSAPDPRFVDATLRRLRRRVLVHEILVLSGARGAALAEHDVEIVRLREQLAAVARAGAAASSTPVSRRPVCEFVRFG